MHAVWFANNTNIKYLPIQVNERFPNLELYNAENCAVAEVSKENFKDLILMETLNLAGNVIEEVKSDTFEDLFGLDSINLGKFFLLEVKNEFETVFCCRS